MSRKPLVFIYGRKEILVLGLLAIMVSSFAFTLGIHFGKKLTVIAPPPHPAHESADSKTNVETVSDQVPSRVEFNEATRGAEKAGDDVIDQATHYEVAKTGLKLDTTRQVDLPGKPKTENAGATTLSKTKVFEETKREDVLFSIQVGSHPSAEEAQTQVDSLKALGMTPLLREAEVQGKGKRFRVFVGHFSTKKEAEETGKRYIEQKVIESYMVTKTQ